MCWSGSIGAQREIKRIGEGFSGHLRIAFVGSATYGVLPNIIKEFRSVISRRRTGTVGYE